MEKVWEYIDLKDTVSAKGIFKRSSVATWSLHPDCFVLGD